MGEFTHSHYSYNSSENSHLSRKMRLENPLEIGGRLFSELTWKVILCWESPFDFRKNIPASIRPWESPPILTGKMRKVVLIKAGSIKLLVEGVIHTFKNWNHVLFWPDALSAPCEIQQRHNGTTLIRDSWTWLVERSQMTFSSYSWILWASGDTMNQP